MPEKRTCSLRQAESCEGSAAGLGCAWLGVAVLFLPGKETEGMYRTMVWRNVVLRCLEAFALGCAVIILCR